MAAKKQKRLASCKHEGNRKVDVIKLDGTEYKVSLCDSCIDKAFDTDAFIKLGISGIRVAEGDDFFIHSIVWKAC